MRLDHLLSKEHLAPGACCCGLSMVVCGWFPLLRGRVCHGGGLLMSGIVDVCCMARCWVLRDHVRLWVWVVSLLGWLLVLLCGVLGLVLVVV